MCIFPQKRKITGIKYSHLKYLSLSKYLNDTKIYNRVIKKRYVNMCGLGLKRSIIAISNRKREDILIIELTLNFLNNKKNNKKIQTKTHDLKTKITL